MSNELSNPLYEAVNEAHAKIQATHKHINPIVEVRHSMRALGIPADVMTVDCLRTDRRITFILHDEQPDIVRYQFMTRDSEDLSQLKQTPLAELTSELLFKWIEDYFG